MCDLHTQALHALAEYQACNHKQTDELAWAYGRISQLIAAHDAMLQIVVRAGALRKADKSDYYSYRRALADVEDAYDQYEQEAQS